MSAAATAAATSRIISAHGETMTLVRDGEGTTVTLKGKRIPGTIESVGNGDQQKFRVKISTAELAASAWAVKVPRSGGTGPGDTLTIGGAVYAVLDVKPLGDGDTVAIYDLEVAG